MILKLTLINDSCTNKYMFTFSKYLVSTIKKKISKFFSVKFQREILVENK